MKASKTAGFIYMIRAGETDRYKVGFTQNTPEHRMTQLQTGCPFPLIIAHAQTALDAKKAETGVHAILADMGKDPVSGEWFELDKEHADKVVIAMRVMTWDQLIWSVIDTLKERCIEVYGDQPEIALLLATMTEMANSVRLLECTPGDLLRAVMPLVPVSDELIAVCDGLYPLKEPGLCGDGQ